MTVFARGVASGDVTPTSVVLWTHVDPGAYSTADVVVRWELGEPGRAPSRAGLVNATTANDRTVHVEVDDLQPGTDYEYHFELGEYAVDGATRTLPMQADRFRFAVTCCSRWGWPGFGLFDSIVAEQPDLLLHLGDSIYEIGEVPPDGRATDPPWDCHTLDDYRRRYRQHRSDASLRRLLAAVPILAVWDDHEVADNAPDPDSVERRQAGQQAWAEWMPSRRADHPAPLDRSFSIGGLIDLALVDSRFSGRTPSSVDGPGDEGAAPGSIISEDQWRRLEHVMTGGSAPWFVFANQVQVGPMTLAARPAVQWPPWRRIVNPDQWDGYPEDRARLYGLLRRATGHPVVLSGDLHSGWSRSLLDGDTEVAHEFTSPSISGSTYADAVRGRLPIPSRLLTWWLRRLNVGIDHLDLTRHGYLVCDVTPDRFTTTFVMADGERHVVTLDRDG